VELVWLLVKKNRKPQHLSILREQNQVATCMQKAAFCEAGHIPFNFGSLLETQGFECKEFMVRQHLLAISVKVYQKVGKT
jgi:hypothetical protein